MSGTTSARDPEEDLVKRFQELMEGLLELDPKPAFFNDIGYEHAHMILATKTHREGNYISVLVMDWMALHLLPVGLKRSAWKIEVRKQWFEPGNVEPASAFLQRVETFLCKQVRGASWVSKIFSKIIEMSRGLGLNRQDFDIKPELVHLWPEQRPRPWSPHITGRVSTCSWSGVIL